MTEGRQPGDNYPQAARKHLLDSAALLAAGRPDGAAYLAGYVVECALKTLLEIETGRADRTHALTVLRRQVAALAMQTSVATAQHCLIVDRLLRDASILRWEPAMRYREPSVSTSVAKMWTRKAAEVYAQSVGAMMLDGKKV